MMMLVQASFMPIARACEEGTTESGVGIVVGDLEWTSE